jgi:hypothetical protein
VDLSTYLIGVIRTAVPAAVGALIGWLATRGLHLDPATVTPYAIGVATASYYALVHALEVKWPKLGVLLGVPKAPSYPPATPDGPVVNDVAAAAVIADPPASDTQA